MKRRTDKTMSRAKSAKDAKVTERGPSSRANARDLKRISLFGRNDTECHFAPWRSFDSAQGMLGGINFPGVVLFKISYVSIYQALILSPFAPCRVRRY